MKWAEISIRTTHEATEAVANIFHDLGASGVIIEDPELINSYRRSGTWEYCDIPEAADSEIVTVKAYLPVDELLDEKLELFEKRVNELVFHDLDKGSGDIHWREIHEEDWAMAWKNYYHPVKIGERVVVKPSWEHYAPVKDEIIIELDPGMAFGTGAHHTTAMCIRCLEEFLKPGACVIDVGTGSGILAVTAAKLGASVVKAIDSDPVAVRVAQENIVANGVKETVEVFCGNLLSPISERAQIIVANIIADIIIGMVPDVLTRLREDGYFIASGIIVERLTDVTTAMIQHDMTIEKVIEEGGWVAIVASKGGD